MAVLARALQHQAVGEAQGRATPELLERSLDDLGVLQSELAMIEEHLERGCDLFRPEPIDGIQDPDGL
ncbi:MAG: hypothetical protein A2V77_24675 [Anaeromyxobacter sp. RBG_16_69_14]|nr:MAG: hypothetical protein A2V77_24675 [Anaeromyxobacter sp. RBG_16_69_14]